MTVRMIKYNREDEEVTMKVVFYGDVEILLLETDCESQFNEQVACITKKSTNLSNWVPAGPSIK